jgi:hypothetical protein
MGTSVGTAFAAKFGGRLGERSADELFDWVKAKTAERKQMKKWDEFDDAPNFFDDDYDRAALAAGMTGELADILRIPENRLDLLGHEAREGLAMYALYRDRDTGEEYTVEAGTTDAVFKRVGAPEPVETAPG